MDPPFGVSEPLPRRGLMCCPCCIDGPTPHYQLQSRLAWHTVCPWHRVLLIDRCLRCGVALQPARLQPGHPLSECHHCGQSLAKKSFGPSIESALEFQRFADLASGSSPLFGDRPLSFPEWMAVARLIISFLLNAIRHPSAGTLQFCRAIGVEISLLQPSSLGLPFEYLSPAERSVLLGQTWVIMQAGPERFMELASCTQLPISAFPSLAKGAPEIAREMLSVLTRHSQHRPGRQGQRQSHTPLMCGRCGTDCREGRIEMASHDACTSAECHECRREMTNAKRFMRASATVRLAIGACSNGACA